MRREALGRLVVRLYPTEIRESTGNEMLGTLLDAGEVSLRAYLLQVASVARSALRARARMELSRPVGRIAASTLCWAAVLSAMSDMVQLIGIRLYWGDTPGSDPETVLHSYVLPALILVLFTLRRNRTTGIVGLAWVAIFLNQHQMISTADFFASVPLPAAGFALLAIRPRTPLPAGRFLWPAIAVVWLLYWVTLLGQQSGVGKITPVVAALVLLPWAPAFALGTAIAWAPTAIYYLDLYQFAGNYPHLLVEAAEFSVGVPVALFTVWIARRAATRT